MPRPIIFGQIENVKEGYLFANRKDMMPSSFHRNWGQGIDLTLHSPRIHNNLHRWNLSQRLRLILAPVLSVSDL